MISVPEMHVPGRLQLLKAEQAATFEIAAAAEAEKP